MWLQVSRMELDLALNEWKSPIIILFMAVFMLLPEVSDVVTKLGNFIGKVN
jgi:hypothetical protein